MDKGNPVLRIPLGYVSTHSPENEHTIEAEYGVNDIYIEFTPRLAEQRSLGGERSIDLYTDGMPIEPILDIKITIDDFDVDTFITYEDASLLKHLIGGFLENWAHLIKIRQKELLKTPE